jgi:membrane fusion protein, adhesin transport system
MASPETATGRPIFRAFRRPQTSPRRQAAGANARMPVGALMRPLQLENGSTPNLPKSILTLGSLAVAATILWGLTTRVNELTVAPGQLRPVGFIHSVQHVEGGQIADIFVSEGQIVQTGEPLVRLEPAAATADLDQLESRRAGLSLRIERISALVADRPVNFGPLGQRFPDLVMSETAAYDSSLAEYQSEQKSLASQISQRSAESKAFKSQVESLKRQLGFQNEQLAMRLGLVAQGYISKSEYAELQRAAEKTNEELVSTTGQMEAAIEAGKEAQLKLGEHQETFRRQLSEDRAKATAELTEMRAAAPKQEDRVSRLVIRSPIAGVIQELAPKSVGQVMRPGEVIATIVPTDQEMIAEVQIPPQEIGHITTGQAADIQVSTFDSARFGKIPGVIQRISPATFQTQEGVPFYKAVIKLDRDFVMVSGERHPLLPGMVVQAEIATGSKSLAAYLLKPIYNNYSTAFSER